MSSFARKFGWVLIFTVLMLFLFPLHFGSFTQTHGPTTVLRALAFAQLLLATLATAISAAIVLMALRWLPEADVPAPVRFPSGSTFQLRC